jgi:hypothetical protein
MKCLVQERKRHAKLLTPAAQTTSISYIRQQQTNKFQPFSQNLKGTNSSSGVRSESLSVFMFAEAGKLVGSKTNATKARLNLIAWPASIDGVHCQRRT